MYLKHIRNMAIASALAITMALTGCSGNTAQESGTASTATQEAQNSTATEEAQNSAEENAMTSLEVIRAMGNGINLGNTLEAYNHQGYLNGSSPTLAETSWGQPTTTHHGGECLRAKLL